MKGPDDGWALHVFGGEAGAEPDCPCCRAHGIPSEIFPGRAEPWDGGLIVVELLTLEDLLRCDCPLCARARP